MAVRTAYVGTQVAGDVLTAANFTKVPGGWLGHAETTTPQTSIGTTAIDLTSLTVTVTVGASRRIKITAGCNFENNAAGANYAILTINEGATVLNDAIAPMGNAGTAQEFAAAHLTVVLTPSTGAHTYKLQAFFQNGSTNATTASANRKPFILVEDIGPAA